MSAGNSSNSSVSGRSSSKWEMFHNCLCLLHQRPRSCCKNLRNMIRFYQSPSFGVYGDCCHIQSYYFAWCHVSAVNDLNDLNQKKRWTLSLIRIFLHHECLFSAKNVYFSKNRPVGAGDAQGCHAMATYRAFCHIRKGRLWPSNHNWHPRIRRPSFGLNSLYIVVFLWKRHKYVCNNVKHFLLVFFPVKKQQWHKCRDSYQTTTTCLQS